MILRALACAAALLVAACGEPERDWPEPSPALWEVVSPEGERGWLFGTIHSLPDDVRWRTPAMEDALTKSATLVVEIAQVGNGTKAAEAFERYSGASNLPPLSRRVAPEDRADLAAFLDRAGMEEDDFAVTDTWAAAMLLANAAREQVNGQSVDQSLIDAGGQVVELESHAAQYALFDNLPVAEQADLLMALARDKGGANERVEAWLTGDLVALGRLSDGLLRDPELREALQTGRNRAWALRIAELVESGHRPFVAVGTAHLFGTDSLPDLLETQGYRVERIQ